MASVFTIEPNPHWVIIDNFSKLPNGAAIYTYRSLNPTEFKPAFADAAGTIPYGEFIQGFGNGTMPPIYWEFNDAAPTEGYYIRVYDRPKNEPGAQFLWDFDGLFGGGSGGGGTITTLIDIENLVVNGEFYSNCGNLTNPGTLVTLAPSNHSGFAGKGNAPDLQPVDADIIFAKNNTSATDAINFVLVSPLGSSNLGDNPTPSIYVNYTCSIGGSGETYKFIQFPIMAGVQNTNDQEFGIRFFARLNSGTNNVNLVLRQFFGNGNNSPSTDVPTIIGGGPLALTPGSTTFQEFLFSHVTMPSIVGKTLGNCGNDALYLQIALPLSPNTIDLDFILPSLFLGGIPSSLDLHTQDEVGAITNSPRTGDIRISINSAILGWLMMDDGTIGNTSSGATHKNINTFPLFKLIWDNFQSNQTLAPMFTSGGVSTPYGADAEADFSANNRLSLTKMAGRVMAGMIPVTHPLGSFLGSETHTQTIGEMPTHDHTGSVVPVSLVLGNQATVAEGGGVNNNVAVAVAAQGGGQPFTIMQPTVYQNVFIKL